MNPTDPATPVSEERKTFVLAQLATVQKYSALPADVRTDLKSLKTEGRIEANFINQMTDLFLADDGQSNPDNPELPQAQKDFRKAYVYGVLGALVKGVKLEEAYDWRYSEDPAEYPPSHPIEGQDPLAE